VQHTSDVLPGIGRDVSQLVTHHWVQAYTVLSAYSALLNSPIN